MIPLALKISPCPLWKHDSRHQPRTFFYYANSLQSCPTLCDPMDHSPPGSSVHGILQARILEWVAISFSRGIFLTQGSNLHLVHLLHWWAGFLPPVQPGKCLLLLRRIYNWLSRLGCPSLDQFAFKTQPYDKAIKSQIEGTDLILRHMLK